MLLTGFLGQKIVALIETAALVCVEKFTDYPQLGRFTLRDEGQCTHVSVDISDVRALSGRTIAIGKVRFQYPHWTNTNTHYHCRSRNSLKVTPTRCLMVSPIYLLLRYVVY